MLKDACRPSFEGPGFPLAIRLKSFNLDRPVTANIRLKTGNAETPLCFDHHLRGSRVPDRIDDCLKQEGISIPSLLLFGSQMAHPILSVLNDEKAQWHGNLRRREADAISRERHTHDFDQFVKRGRPNSSCGTLRVPLRSAEWPTLTISTGGAGTSKLISNPKRARAVYVAIAAIRSFFFHVRAGGSLARITAIVGPQVRWAIFRISAARSPITTHGAIVLPVVTRGMMEPSAMRRLSIPWTLREPSTTDIASCPILAVHV